MYGFYLYERSTFYNFILAVFVEADPENKGRVTFDQFDSLLDRAAKVPRHFGLALPDSDKTKRTAMFKDMELQRDGKGTGFVTMRVFWEWTLEHTAKVIGDYKAGKARSLRRMWVWTITNSTVWMIMLILCTAMENSWASSLPKYLMKRR